jgi:hypothetical protein
MDYFQNERTTGSGYFKTLKELAISMKEPTVIKVVENRFFSF